MPNTLIHWLLDISITESAPSYYIKPDKPDKTDKTDKTDKIVKTKGKEIIKNKFIITDDEIKYFLTLLNNTYLNNYSKWLIVASCLKSVDKFDIFNEWSKASNKYNEQENLNIYNNIDTKIDINYLVHILNTEFKQNIKLIDRYKIYVPISEMPSKIITSTIHEKYINIPVNTFNENDTIILSSCCGSGKTTGTAKAISNYNKHSDTQYKIISIVSKISLANQHIKSFGDENIKLVSYLDASKNVLSDSLVICINSLEILSDIPSAEYQDYIIYIDEATSFTLDITHNTTLQNKLKSCYSILTKIIKNAHKVIISDANINDNCFNLIKSRNNNKSHYINNTFVKFEGVKAYHCHDETQFLEQMLINVKNSQYFLIGSDSCSTVSRFYYKCLEAATPEQKLNFILITADTNYKIEDVSEQFKNKFVFYSPSIVFGIDFSIDQAQDVFIYNKGSSIDPALIFQQTTRTRKINNLYFYSEIPTHQPLYDNLEQCKTYFKSINSTSKEINDICKVLDENDNLNIIENSFFNLYTYNEYMLDTYQTQKTKHYIDILIRNGFIVSDIGIKSKISKDDNKLMNQVIADIKEEIFNDFLESGETANELLKNNLNILGLNETEDTDILNEYQDIITDKFKTEEHLNIIRLLKDEQYINCKLMDQKTNSFNIASLGSSYNKIKLLIQLEKDMKLNRLQIDIDTAQYFELTDKRYELIKKVFKITKAKPLTKILLFQLYIAMIKSIGSINLITTKRSGKLNTSLYSLNNETINRHVQLNKIKNPSFNNYDKDIIKLLQLKVADTPYPFNEDE
jgi:hypothetical protein